MRIYLVRHADADYRDDVLTDNGVREAHALAKRLADYRIDTFYSSPVRRAQQTATIAAQHVGSMPTIEPWLAEPHDWRLDHPRWGSLAIWDIPGELVRARQLEGKISELTHPTIRRHNAFLQAQSDTLLERHGYQREGEIYRCLHPHRQSIAVIAHHGIGLMWLAHLLALPLWLVWSGFWLAPSSVTTILLDERSPEWATPRCLGLGDVSHLYQAGLPVQPRGIIGNFE
ncbi:histidine phosphatase family protein [Candidatus Gracilibacteria bacterium]|nr:histidine phosphatase family protein [Candidatus Gracilibacteria bacterium]